jgi:hypothetical protein
MKGKLQSSPGTSVRFTAPERAPPFLRSSPHTAIGPNRRQRTREEVMAGWR